MSTIIAISTNRPDEFVEFSIALAHGLETSGGTVYSPIPVVDPRARQMVPPADHVIVVLGTADAFAQVYQNLVGHLARGANIALTLTNVKVDDADNRVTVTAPNVPSEDMLRQQLLI